MGFIKGNNSFYIQFIYIHNIHCTFFNVIALLATSVALYLGLHCIDVVILYACITTIKGLVDFVIPVMEDGDNKTVISCSNHLLSNHILLDILIYISYLFGIYLFSKVCGYKLSSSFLSSSLLLLLLLFCASSYAYLPLHVFFLLFFLVSACPPLPFSSLFLAVTHVCMLPFFL